VNTKQAQYLTGLFVVYFYYHHHLYLA